MSAAGSVIFIIFAAAQDVILAPVLIARRFHDVLTDGPVFMPPPSPLPVPASRRRDAWLGGADEGDGLFPLMGGEHLAAGWIFPPASNDVNLDTADSQFTYLTKTTKNRSSG